jgi:hypothetical protein
MRAEIDAATDRLQVLHGLKQANPFAHTRRMQAQRQRESADPCTNNEDIVSTRLDHVIDLRRRFVVY